MRTQIHHQGDMWKKGGLEVNGFQKKKDDVRSSRLASRSHGPLWGRVCQGDTGGRRGWGCGGGVRERGIVSVLTLSMGVGSVAIHVSYLPLSFPDWSVRWWSTGAVSAGGCWRGGIQPLHSLPTPTFSLQVLFSLLFRPLLSLPHPPLSPPLFFSLSPEWWGRSSAFLSELALLCHSNAVVWFGCLQLSVLAWDGANESRVTDEKLRWPAPERQKKKKGPNGVASACSLFSHSLSSRHRRGLLGSKGLASKGATNHMRWGLIVGYTSASVPAFITLLNCSPGQ